MAMQTPEIAVIGGGTGTSTLLEGLKEFTPNITAIVGMADNGGGTGVLRADMDASPFGDLRQCLVALARNRHLAEAFEYRFRIGRNNQQSLGNLNLAAMEEMLGGVEASIAYWSKELDIVGQVIPVSTDKHHLVVYDGGRPIVGEQHIDKMTFKTLRPRVDIEPMANLNPNARKALLTADIVLFAPGSHHTSMLPPLLVNGMKQVLNDARAPLISVANLFNSPGQTDNWHVVDHVQEKERYIGREQIDYVLYNTLVLDPALVKRYNAEHKQPVKTDVERFREIRAQAIGRPLVAHMMSGEKKPSLRHDAAEVGQFVLELLDGDRFGKVAWAIDVEAAGDSDVVRE